MDSLEIAQGQFIAVVGPSGCGKSTLLDILALASAPQKAARFEIGVGEEHCIKLTGKSAAGLAVIRRDFLGYVLQVGGLFPFLSVADNILLPRRLKGLSARMSDITGLAKELGISEHLKKKPAYLSGGQRQRAAIARAMSHEPSIVLADEPTGAVDKITAQAICSLLKKTALARGTTVVMVTHDESLVGQIADRRFTFKLESGASGIISRLVESRL